jgi:EAL domain-containing protein (putative c-di-GMP-specific phosphodiesterase class I)
MLAMGAALGVRVVAEGVETLEQAAFLRAGGCNALQGYLYAPPLTPTELEHLLFRTDYLRRPESARTAQPA